MLLFLFLPRGGARRFERAHARIKGMKTMRMMGRPTMTHKLVDPDMLFVKCEDGGELV